MRIVRTKNPVLINAQVGESKKVYFKISREETDYDRAEDSPGTKSFMVQLLKEISSENGVPTLVPCGSSYAQYKRSTFKSLFGALTLNQFEEQIPDLALGQIAYNGDKFWGVTENDLEIYEGEVIFQ